MPKNIRAMLSVIVALVAAVTFYVEMQAGAGALKWVVLALAAFMIYAARAGAHPYAGGPAPRAHQRTVQEIR